jgi:hypothetical protein
MPDTGAPWNIPYVENADLVSDWPADSLLVANAVAAGLSAAGGLVEVKHALFTGTQTNSTASGANFSVTSLSITHTLADTSNKLILMGYVGVGASSSQLGSVGIAFADDGTPIGVGTPDPSRTSVGAGGRVTTATNNTITTMPSIHLVYTPSNPADAHTYTLEAFNMDPSTRTIYINRTESDTSAADRGRGVSVLTLMEVQV